MTKYEYRLHKLIAEQDARMIKSLKNGDMDSYQDALEEKSFLEKELHDHLLDIGVAFVW